MDQKGTWRCQLNKGSCKKHTQRGGFADLRPESLSPSHSFIVSTATGPVAPILWARAITWRSIAACARAGWVSMLLLEWLQNAVQPPGARAHRPRRQRLQPAHVSSFKQVQLNTMQL